jgi:hypothetical protein
VRDIDLSGARFPALEHGEKPVSSPLVRLDSACNAPLRKLLDLHFSLEHCTFIREKIALTIDG